MALQLNLLGRAAEITLNDPVTKNALHDALVAELIEVLRDIAGRREIEAIVVRGAGNVFCSGGNFDELATMREMVREPGGQDAVREKVRRNSRLVEQLQDQPQRIVAVLDGAVVGAGIGLAAACDLRIASPSLRVIGGFDRLGLTSDMGTAPLLSRAVGAGAAAELLVNGQTWDAQTAHARGFTSELLSAEELYQRVDSLLAKLRPGDGARSRLQRRAIADPAMLAACLDREAQCFAESIRIVSAYDSPDHAQIRAPESGTGEK